MRITIASGKGGTGKTTVATSLALCREGPTRLLDCDVEEPNCHLFMKPEIDSRETVRVMIPAIDEATCTACGLCAEVCEYNALAALKTAPLLFPELCHSCWGCLYACPVDAISEGAREVGQIEAGRSGAVAFARGVLRIGETQAPPLIDAVKRLAWYGDNDGAAMTIVDAPPGTSCPVIAAVRGADYVVLVTEPTPFGLHDLGLAVDMARRLGLRVGVVINRSDIGDDQVRRYCEREQIVVLAEFPNDRAVAEAYSRGAPMATVSDEARRRFGDLWAAIEREVGR